MNLVYRKYHVGDAPEITTLYSRAFAKSLYPKMVQDTLWKFIEKPNFNPEFLNICEDSDNQRIVGFIASEVSEVHFSNRIIKMGFINEVGTDPDYQKQGIAKKLMQMALEVFKSAGTEFSCLVADPKGHPRSKLYLPAGYRDICFNKACFHFTSISNLIRDIPLTIIFSPILLLYKGIVGLIQSIRKLHNTSEYQIEVKDGLPFSAFYDAANKLMVANYDLFPVRTKEDWICLREKVNHPGEKPLYIVALKDGQIIAGVSITDRMADLHFLHFKVRLGTVGEYFIDKTRFSNPKTLQKFTDWFNGIVLDTARIRKIAALLFFPSDQDRFLIQSLHRWGIPTVNAGIYMLRDDAGRKLDPPFIHNEKPIFISTYDSMGIP